MKKVVTILLTILMLFTLFQGASIENVVKAEGNDQWVKLYGGPIWSLAIDPTNTQVIYAGLAVGGGMFKSTDGGTSWSKMNMNLGLTSANIVNSIAIDPKNTDIIYIATYGGVYKSTDGGMSWTWITESISRGEFIIQCIAIDPTNTQVIYAGAGEDKGVYKSIDGGISWTQINKGFTGAFRSQDVYSLVIDPTNTNIVYAGTVDGVYKLVTAFTITATAGSGGTISPSGTITVNSGDSKIFTIIPNSGYKISLLKVDGASKGSISSYTFVNITSNHTIEAIFEKIVVPPSQRVIILQIGKSTFTVNGGIRTLDSPPIIKNNRTLLPIRAIIESLGGTVSWDATERKVTVILGSNTIELWIGKNTAKVNGGYTPIDSTNSKVVPEIINSRTMLPLRFVTENVGATVDWDGTTKTITITYPKS